MEINEETQGQFDSQQTMIRVNSNPDLQRQSSRELQKIKERAEKHLEREGLKRERKIQKKTKRMENKIKKRNALADAET